MTPSGQVRDDRSGPVEDISMHCISEKIGTLLGAMGEENMQTRIKSSQPADGFGPRAF